MEARRNVEFTSEQELWRSSTPQSSSINANNQTATMMKMPATTMPANIAGPSPQKPIRNSFKVPSEGAYRLLEELALNPPKTPQRKLRPFPSTKLSFILANPESDSQAGAKDKEDSDGSPLHFVFNIAESLPLYLLKSPKTASIKEKAPPMTFRVMPTCHDINMVSTTNNKMDVLIGFETGDVLIYDPLNKPSGIQYNKEPRMSTGRVHAVKWVPGSPTLFGAAFANGTILFMDREREEPPAAANSGPKDFEGFSVVRQKNNKVNPVSKWYISKKPINDMSFSPDGKHLAVAGQDGYMRIFNYEDEVLLASFRSYYGGFLCVSWSHDGKFLATGGEDDLVSIWSFHERSLLARGQGHRSWVSWAGFDRSGAIYVAVYTDHSGDAAKSPHLLPDLRANSVTYRLGSVGEDTRVCLWDFDREVLRRPRILSLSFSRPETSPPKGHNSNGVTSTTKKNSHPPVPNFIAAGSVPLPSIIESKPRNEVAVLQPLVAHRAHHEPVTDIVFLKDTVVTCCWGKVKFWARPDPSSLSTSSLSDLNSSLSSSVPDPDAPINSTTTTPISATNGQFTTPPPSPPTTR